MKKSILILAAFAFVAFSCTKTEVKDDTPKKGINFSAYTAKPTKAVPGPQVDVTNTTLGDFEVTAIGNGAIYFNNVTFTKNTVWESTTKYFWPAFPLNFYAYNTPRNAASFIPSITTSGQTLYVKPTTVLANQEDLVAAYEKNKKEENANSTESSLPITFNHYLTQVIVKAKNSSSTYKVVVDGVKLANLAGDGTYTFSDNTMTATAAKINKAESSDYIAGFTAKELNGTEQEVMTNEGTGKWYLIPQSVTAWNRVKDDVVASDMKNTNHGTYLALKVKITANGGALKIYPATGDDSGWMAIPIPTTGILTDAGVATSIFAQGKKYTITLDFFSATGKGAGYVDPEDPSDLDGNNAATDDSGKKIIGGEIKFDATVDPWDNVTINIAL